MQHNLIVAAYWYEGSLRLLAHQHHGILRRGKKLEASDKDVVCCFHSVAALQAEGNVHIHVAINGSGGEESTVVAIKKGF